MSEIFSDVSTEQEEAAKALTKDVPGITTEQALAAVRSSDNHEERKKVALMFKATKATPKNVAAAEQIKKLEAEYEALDKKYQEAKGNPVHALSKSLVSYQNDLHKLRMQLKDLQAQA